ncbi:MAG: HD domain-containing protein [Ruminococcus sp.]|jgi:uncharacterized protein
MRDMERVNRIWNHPLYQKHLKSLLEAEQERAFCRHTVEHFLDVARLTYIFVLEAGISIPKDVIYGAALLHDIGRRQQYDHGIPHEKASAEIAGQILPECGYTEEESREILNAVLSHRRKEEGENFNTLMYRADKMSRLCFGCPSEPQCDWSAEKKNMTIQY